VLDGVTFDVLEGETLALVGESGSGKTVTALSILRLLDPPGFVAAGEALWRGRDLLALGTGEMRGVRGREIAMVFQDPLAALNPVITAGRQVEEAVLAHERLSRSAARERSAGLLEEVGIPRARATAFPHQLSGGMRQRVLLAMALASRPRLLIADEPTTALDVTVQAQILRLLREVQRSRGMSVLLITHDMGVVAELADRVAVMYAGRIVETGPAAAVFDSPRHPYTAALFDAMPRPGASRGPLRAIPGEAPSPSRWPAGCRFHPRCGMSIPACASGPPPLEPVGQGRTSACIRHADLAVLRGGAA
jgi:oligopeptide/dipeptide ABC transporter ATP-binding protein